MGKGEEGGGSGAKKPIKQEGLTWRPFVFGGLASMTAEVFTFPIDTSKTRLQIQGQGGNLAQLKYRGMFHAIYLIGKEEGARALFNGIAPSLMRQATYGTIKIGIYHSLKKKVNELRPAKGDGENLLNNVFCGGVAGVTSSSIANPTDVLKIRMQAQSSSGGGGNAREGMFAVLKRAYQSDGFFGLWRGVGPNASRAAVIAAVELPAYDKFKHLLVSNGYMNDNVFAHFTASFGAGFCGALASNPVDVAKTRLMNQSKRGRTSNGVVIYRGTLHCFAETIRNEGFFALYKGFIPNYVRLGPWNIIFFMTYEQLKNLNL